MSILSTRFLHETFLTDLARGLSEAPISPADYGRIAAKIQQALAGEVPTAVVADHYAGALNFQLLRACTPRPVARAFGSERLREDFTALDSQGIVVDLQRDSFSIDKPVLEGTCSKDALDRILLDNDSFENFLVYIQEFPLKGQVQLVDRTSLGYSSGKLRFRLTVPGVMTSHLRRAYPERFLEAAFVGEHVTPKEMGFLYENNRSRPVTLRTAFAEVHDNGKASHPLVDYWHEELHRSVNSSRSLVVQDGSHILYQQAFRVFSFHEIGECGVDDVLESLSDLNKVNSPIALRDAWERLCTGLIVYMGDLDRCERFVREALDLLKTKMPEGYFQPLQEAGDQALELIERRRAGRII